MTLTSPVKSSVLAGSALEPEGAESVPHGPKLCRCCGSHSAKSFTRRARNCSGWRWIHLRQWLWRPPMVHNKCIGPQYGSQYTICLTMGTSSMAPLILGNSRLSMQLLLEALHALHVKSPNWRDGMIVFINGIHGGGNDMDPKMLPTLLRPKPAPDLKNQSLKPLTLNPQPLQFRVQPLTLNI